MIDAIFLIFTGSVFVKIPAAPAFFAYTGQAANDA
jgi:hypothetical protein